MSFRKIFQAPGGGVRLDAFTHYYALEYLKKNKPRAIYIAYGETDDFAHGGDYSAYLKSAHRTDQFIGELWNWVQSNDEYKDKTTFIITTDHGRGTEPLDTWRGHGAKVVGGGEIWFAIIGPDTPALGEVKREEQLHQNQVANTIAQLMGVKFGNEMAGEAIGTVFEMK